MNVRPLEPLVLIAVILAAFPLAAGITPSLPEPSPSVGPVPGPGPVNPEPCPLNPEPSSSGRGIVFDFELLTEREQVEANVSDPTSTSLSIVVVVRNNATAPLSVHLSATINLGGTAKLDPAQTPLMLYQATSNVVVSVNLPESTTSDSMGYLRIDGVCDQNPTVTNTLQVRVTVKQWHRVVIEKFSLSSGSPLERDMVQLGARVTNAGNGPSNFAASAMVDGKPLKVKIDGYTAPANHTVSLAPGRFFMLAASWQASYGHHNFVIEVTDTGREGEANVSAVLSKDTKVASVFVGLNYRDWIPYIYITMIVLVAAALLGYKYRKKLGPRLRRLRRRLGRKKPGEEGEVELGDGEDHDDEDAEDDEYDDDDEEYDDDYDDDDEEYDDEEDEEDEEDGDEEAPPAKRPPAGKGASAPPKKLAALPVKRPAAAPLKRGAAIPRKEPGSPAQGPARPRMSQEFKKGMASARPAAKAGMIVVGDPDEMRPAAAKRRPPARTDERPPAKAGGLHPIGDASLPPPEGSGLLLDEEE
jgi:hypothetical protein